MRMTFGEIYRTLALEPWWAAQSRKFRVLAARYYAGVDTLEQLKALGYSQPVTEHHTQPQTLTHSEIQTIVNLR